MNHSWKYAGPAASAVARACELCGAEGRRFRTCHGYTRWETRPGEDGAWSAGRVPQCPAERKSTYVSVQALLAARLRSEGVVPAGADLELEHLPGDWRKPAVPEHPAWLAKWRQDGEQRMVFSCHSMRSCAESPQVRMSGGQVIPLRYGEPAVNSSVRMLEIAEGQTWLSRGGTLVRITRTDDDLIAYEKVAGPGRDSGRLRARSLLAGYTEVTR